jgi:DNA-binding GntR family transcriptional regulator
MPSKSSFDLRRYPRLHSILLDGANGDRSLADDVYDSILLRIIRGELRGGTELKSTRLARELSVSRTPVVKALARLTADGIVSHQLHQRAVVRPGAEEWLVDIHHIRQQLEPQAAAAAAGHIPPDVRADLERLARDARNAAGPAWRVASRYLDYALHLVVAEFCGNLPLREAIRKCWTYKRLSYEAGHDSDRDLKRNYRDHAAILARLDAGDAAGAAGMMRQHLASAEKRRTSQRIV